METEPEKLLSKAEVARCVGRSIATVQRWVRVGLIDDYVVDGKIREDFLENWQSIINLKHTTGRMLEDRMEPVRESRESIENDIRCGNMELMPVEQARQLKYTMEAKIAEIDYLEKSSQLVKEQGQVFFTIARMLRDKLMQFKDNASLRLVGLDDVHEIEKILHNGIFEVFEEVEGIFNERVK